MTGEPKPEAPDLERKRVWKTPAGVALCALDDIAEPGARGFVLQAERMIESVAADVTGDKAGANAAANAEALADIRAGFAQLKAVQPTVVAPKQAAIDDPGFQGLVGRIEAAAAKLQ